MDHQLYDIIAQYGIYAVFALCTVEGDITLLISGTMAHGGLFGNWGFLKVLIAGTLGGGSAILISKYIYGIRMAVCVSYGVSRMPYPRFVLLSLVSCFTWVLLLSGIGYFFSGAITSIIGDFKQVGVALFFVVMFGIIIFYVIERYWLSERVEDANPETLHRIEEKLLAVEEVGKTTLHDLGERLHLTREPNREERIEQDESRVNVAAKPFPESDKKSIDL